MDDKAINELGNKVRNYLFIVGILGYVLGFISGMSGRC